jgi:Planctomycete cytochrome C
MKTAVALTVLGLLLAGLSATAQTPPENHWDISKVDVSKLPPASDQKGVTFDKDILPLFKASCIRCHGEQKPRGGLRLDSLAAVLKGGRDGKMVVPDDSKKSLLVAAAAGINDSIAMPPKRRPRGGTGGPPPGGTGSNTNGPGGGPGGPGRSGPPAKPLTAEEVGLVRAWIDQGAK